MVFKEPDYSKIDDCDFQPSSTLQSIDVSWTVWVAVRNMRHQFFGGRGGKFSSLLGYKEMDKEGLWIIDGALLS